MRGDLGDWLQAGLHPRWIQGKVHLHLLRDLSHQAAPSSGKHDPQAPSMVNPFPIPYLHHKSLIT